MRHATEADERGEAGPAVNLTEVCIRRPVMAWMMMGATLVFGVVAASRIGISQFPDVDFPSVALVA